MSSKVSYMPVQSMPKSELLNVIANNIDQNATDRRFNDQANRSEKHFQLEMARKNRKDALDISREKRLDKRYADSITYRDKKDAEAKQNEADAVQGLLDASLVGFDPETTSMEDVADYSQTVDEYNTDTVNKTLAGANLEYGTVDKTLTQTEKDDLEKYNSLSNIKDEIEKRRKELEFAGGTVPETEYDGVLSKIGKKLGSGARYGYEAIAENIANPVADLFRNPSEEIDADELMAQNSKISKQNLKIKDPLSDYRTRIKELQALKTKNENTRTKNKENNDLVEKILSDNKTKVYDGTSTKKEKVMLNRQEYNQSSSKELADAIKLVLSKKTSTAYKKAALTKLTGDKKTADTLYKADLKEEMTKLSKRIERAEELSDKKEVARLKAKLSFLSKKKIAEFKANSAETIAGIKNTNAKTKRTENQTKNNK